MKRCQHESKCQVLVEFEFCPLHSDAKIHELRAELGQARHDLGNLKNAYGRDRELWAQQLENMRVACHLAMTDAIVRCWQYVRARKPDAPPAECWRPIREAILKMEPGLRDLLLKKAEQVPPAP